ncbi:MAG: CBS domain-containing protein [Candidatus Poribacteria bacterium]
MDAEKLQAPITELNVRQPLVVGQDAPAREAIDRLKEKGAGCVLVLDDDGYLLGIFTERDVMQKLAPLGSAAADRPVSEFMTPGPTVLHQDDSIVYALHQMHLGGYRHIPLVDDDEKPRHIVSVRTVVDYLAERLSADDLRHDA